MKMREVLAEAPGLASDRLVIPQPLLELTTRYALILSIHCSLHFKSYCLPRGLQPAPATGYYPYHAAKPAGTSATVTCP